MDGLEGQVWGHQGSTGDSSWEPLESACTGLLEQSRQTPGMMGLRNTASERKSTLNDLLLVVLSGGGFEAVATRKSRRLEDQPGPAPSYKESEDSSRDGDGEASSHVSRRDGRAEAVAGAR